MALFIASYVPSPVLNITHINRAHMGTYVCEAFNGIPPNDTQEFRVDVYCECKVSLLSPHILLPSFPDYPGGGDCCGRLPGPDHHSGVPGGVLAPGCQVSIYTDINILDLTPSSLPQLLGEGGQSPGSRQ